LVLALATHQRLHHFWWSSRTRERRGRRGKRSDLEVVEPDRRALLLKSGPAGAPRSGRCGCAARGVSEIRHSVKI